MKLLEGRTAIITGGSRGIGKAIVKKFAEQGANIAFTFTRDTEATKAFEAEINEMGVRAKGYAFDVSDFEACQNFVTEVHKEFGSIDALINNAGITQDNLLMRMSEDQWDGVINVNLKSIFNLTKAVQRPMLKQRKGAIVNLTSVVGISGNAGQSNYAASKAGIIGFTKSIAKELGSRNIRCNALAPGFVITEMTGELSEDVKKQWVETIPLKRGAEPEEIANVALFLASDLSSYVSGQTLTACGGMNT